MINQIGYRRNATVSASVHWDPALDTTRDHDQWSKCFARRSDRGETRSRIVFGQRL